MPICQGVLPVRQDVPLIVDCRKTYFIQFYRAQVVIDRPKLTEFGFGCGRWISQNVKKIFVTDVFLDVIFLYTLDFFHRFFYHTISCTFWLWDRQIRGEGGTGLRLHLSQDSVIFLAATKLSLIGCSGNYTVKISGGHNRFSGGTVPFCPWLRPWVSL